MTKFMLNFRMSADIAAAYATISPEEMAESVGQWQGWIQGIVAQGNFVATDRLDYGGMVLTGPAAVATDGPFIEVKEMLGGYIIITAADLDAAAVQAKGCPILTMGGSVEIRPILPF